MPKFLGCIGFAKSVEQEPGIWTETIEDRMYYGDLLRQSRQLQSSGRVNDNITISNELSIIADPYARENFYQIRYAEFAGAKWKVTDVEVQYPRLRLTLGGVWNGD